MVRKGGKLVIADKWPSVERDRQPELAFSRNQSGWTADRVTRTGAPATDLRLADIEAIKLY